MSGTFKKLKKFILNDMKMSHIYQPVMLSELLKSGGKASVYEIAKSISRKDPSQIEYYEKITKNMVGDVLRNRSIVKSNKIKNRIFDFELCEHTNLSDEEVKELIELCEGKLSAFLQERGERIWAHRRRSRDPITGTVRYEVLKRAKYRCELCGIMGRDKALEVDHIIPKNCGGSDEISNYQALCYSCNASKRDRDDTDLRGVSSSYNDRNKGCPFCEINSSRSIIEETELCYGIHDGFPVTDLHTLIIPKRHVSDYFELYQPELNAINSMAKSLKNVLMKSDASIQGFNLGINNGKTAGQTIMHCHIHLIPRRNGDINNPHGGVRAIIPGKAEY